MARQRGKKWGRRQRQGRVIEVVGAVSEVQARGESWDSPLHSWQRAGLVNSTKVALSRIWNTCYHVSLGAPHALFLRHPQPAAAGGPACCAAPTCSISSAALLCLLCPLRRQAGRPPRAPRFLPGHEDSVHSSEGPHSEWASVRGEPRACSHLADQPGKDQPSLQAVLFGAQNTSASVTCVCDAVCLQLKDAP